MLKKETLIQLRMPFSIFLLPVFLFAWSQIPAAGWEGVLVVFILLHVLVYPAANGYAGSFENIGSSRQLRWLVNGMDLLAILLAYRISTLFAAQISGLVLASRIYSNPKSRFNTFPVLSFLWMTFFYGFGVFWAVQTALGGADSEYAGFTHQIWAKTMISALIASMFLFTQLYQNDLNKRDGIKTLSMQLGYRGSFIFYILVFVLADLAAWQHFEEQGAFRFFLVLQFFLLPLLVYGLFWFVQVKKNALAADYDHATRMRLLTCFCLNLCFLSFLISHWLAR